MIEFSITVDINAPSTRVWSIMSDVERWHEWTSSVRGITLWGTRPIAVGTRALVRQPRFPPALWTVTTLDAGRGFTWVSRAPGLRVVARHEVEPTPAGSRATLSLTYTGIVGRALARWTRAITNRYLALEAAGLKRRSEELV